MCMGSRAGRREPRRWEEQNRTTHLELVDTALQGIDQVVHIGLVHKVLEILGLLTLGPEDGVHGRVLEPVQDAGEAADGDVEQMYVVVELLLLVFVCPDEAALHSIQLLNQTDEAPVQEAAVGRQLDGSLMVVGGACDHVASLDQLMHRGEAALSLHQVFDKTLERDGGRGFAVIGVEIVALGRRTALRHGAGAAGRGGRGLGGGGGRHACPGNVYIYSCWRGS